MTGEHHGIRKPKEEPRYDKTNVDLDKSDVDNMNISNNFLLLKNNKSKMQESLLNQHEKVYNYY